MRDSKACAADAVASQAESAQAPRRPIERNRRNADAERGQLGRKDATFVGHEIHGNGRRKHAGKEGVQCAAVIDHGSLFPAMMMARPMVMMRRVVECRRIRDRERFGRRRHDAGKLRHQEQRDQRTDEARYRPEPVHAPHCAAARHDRQSGALTTPVEPDPPQAQRIAEDAHRRRGLTSSQSFLDYSRTRRKRNALPTTLTEESAIAAAAMIGESRIPNAG